MEVKFNQDLNSYEYLIMFDLASKITGVCVWDIKKGKPLNTYVIKIKGEGELPFAELKAKINTFFDKFEKEIGYGKYFVSKEMMPTQIHGGSSTVQTFVALAKSHVILDVCCYERGIPCYDYKGVAPTTTHAYFRHINGLDIGNKVTKEMVRDYLYGIFPTELKITTLDETDAVFLAKTLCEFKWDKDIAEKIREIKRHKKELKAAHAISALDQEIKRLEKMKVALKLKEEEYGKEN